MKKKYIIPTLLLVIALLVVSVILLIELRAVNGKISVLQSQNAQLQDKVNKQATDMKVFDGVDKRDLLAVCSEKAKTQYSEFIRANSISVTEGNVTTLSPKSPNTIRQAEESLQLSEKSCTDRFKN